MDVRDVKKEYPELVNLAHDRAACGGFPAPFSASDYLMWVLDEKGIQEDNANQDDTFDFGPYIEHLDGFCQKLIALGVSPSRPYWVEGYKVWFKGIRETTWVSNGLDFDTPELAHKYGVELLSRWYGAEDFVVLPYAFQPQGSVTDAEVEENRVEV